MTIESTTLRVLPGASLSMTHTNRTGTSTAVDGRSSFRCDYETHRGSRLDITASDIAGQIESCGTFRQSTIRNSTLHDGTVSIRRSDDVVFDQVTFEDAPIKVGELTYATIRGKLTGTTIQACNWGDSCSVEAANVDWGSPQGPFAEDGASLTCGAVWTRPWKDETVSPATRLFGNGNCDETDTPWETTEVRRKAFNAAIASTDFDCSQGIEESCEVRERAFRCFAAAVDLAAAFLPPPIPTVSVTSGQTEVGEPFAASVAEAGSRYLINALPGHGDAIEVGHATSYGGKLLGAVKLVIAIGDAYEQCMPT